jgi:hypothetical protein
MKIILALASFILSSSMCLGQTIDHKDFFGINLNHKLGDFGYARFDLYVLQSESKADDIAIPIILNEEYYANLDANFLSLGFDYINILFDKEPNSNKIVGVVSAKKFDSEADYNLNSSSSYKEIYSLLEIKYGAPDQTMMKKGLYENNIWESDTYSLALNSITRDLNISVYFFLK